ncbi:MAG TPA: hypothetical protein DC013_03240 [Ruminococcaceae bacterium]|jgi:DNA-binding GntR family transcriptional regulator|nr:hypothetical protein [Oscillospiraceae bacterium]
MELKMGEPLVEEDLAEEYGVSRTPVRDALRRLEHEGLVSIIPYKGSVVREITAEDITEIYIIRQALESICSKNTAAAITDVNIEKLESYWRESMRLLEEGNYQMSSEYGDKIHHVIISIGGSKRIFQIINELSAQTLQLGKVAATLPGRLEKSNEEHHLIINAIKAHDRELAGKLMEEHILSTQKDMLLALKNSHL